MDTVFLLSTDDLSELDAYSTGHETPDNPICIGVDSLGRLLVGCDNAQENEDGDTANINIFRVKKNSDNEPVLEYIDGWNLSSGASIGTIAGLPDEYVQGNYQDDNPALIIKDLLTNSRYGAGLDESTYIDTDSFNAVADICDANQYATSFIFKEQQPVFDMIDYVCSHCNAFLYKTGGKIGLGIFSDQESVATITQADLINEYDGNGNPQPAVQVKKRPYKETANKIELTWTDRESGYQAAVATANEEVDQRISGRVRIKSVHMDGICDADYASKMAWRLLFESMYRFTTYTFELGFKYMALEPGDVITLSDGDKIDSQRCRILSIEESENGQHLQLTAVEDQPYMYDAIAEGTSQTEASIYEIPTLLDATVTIIEDSTDNRLLVNIAPGNDNITGAIIYTSWDGVTFEEKTDVTIDMTTAGDHGATGTTTTTLPAYTAVIHRPDEYVLVDIGEYASLASQSDAGFYGSNPQLCQIGDEVIAFQTAEDQGSGIWKLSGLIRGMHGTKPVAHAVSDTFTYIDATYIYNYHEEELGSTVYVKVVVTYGEFYQDIEDITAASHKILGLYYSPSAPSLVRITDDAGVDVDNEWDTNYSGANVTIGWYLAAKKDGFNRLGFNYGGSIFEWTDAIETAGTEPADNDGIGWGQYTADSSIEDVIVKIEDTAETLINEVVSAVDEEQTLTYAAADEINSENPAVIKVIPRAIYRNSRQTDITITKV